MDEVTLSPPVVRGRIFRRDRKDRMLQRRLVGPVVLGMLATGGFITYSAAPVSAASLQATDYQGLSDPSRVLTGDFNNDQKTDIALVGGSGWTKAPIAFSRGDGNYGVTAGNVGDGFGAWANDTGAKPLAGDFNHDNRTDIALVGVTGLTTVPIAFSQGDGTYNVTGGNVGDGFAAWSRDPRAKPLAGDFNNDGNTDIALVGVRGLTTVPIAFSLGDGTYNVVAREVESGFSARSKAAGVRPVAGDFDNDKKTDIALIGGSGWTTAPIAFSQGNGTFAVANSNVGAGFGAWANDGSAKPLVDDFNNDGKTDIALVGVDGLTTVPIAFSLGNGAYNVTGGDVGTGFSAWSRDPKATPLAGDYNKDGNTDIALVGVDGLTTVPIAFSLGNGNYNVVAHPAGDFPTHSRAAGVKPVTGDFNNDKMTDIALVGGSGWTTAPIAFSQGNGTFAVTSGDVGTGFGAWANEVAMPPWPGMEGWQEAHHILYANKDWTEEAQGITTNGSSWFVGSNASGRKRLYKFGSGFPQGDDTVVASLALPQNAGSHLGPPVYDAKRNRIVVAVEPSNIWVINPDTMTTETVEPLGGSGFKPQGNSIPWAAFNPSDGLLYSSAYGKSDQSIKVVDKIHVYDPEDHFKWVRSISLSHPISEVQGGAISPRGNVYLSAHDGLKMHGFNLLTGEYLGSSPVDAKNSDFGELEGITLGEFDWGSGSKTSMTSLLLDNDWNNGDDAHISFYSVPDANKL